MAKRKPARSVKKGNRFGGPYLAAAFYCEGIIEDKLDGALTAVRIIDTVKIILPPEAPADFPSDSNRLPVHIHALLIFKSGSAPGEHRVKVVAESPSGKRQTIKEQTLPLTQPPQGGLNFRVHQTIEIMKGGLFWLHVFLDGKRLTRMPLLISVERTQNAHDPAASKDGT